MNTPIIDFVDEYVRSDALRLHMPGHKGTGFLGVEGRDITEVYGADAITCPKGVILKSEENAARIFGAAKTVYSTEGSTAAIKIMLYLAVMHAKHTGKTPYILAARNAHNAFTAAAELLGFDFGFIAGDGVLTSGVTPDKLKTALSVSKTLPSAVYVTSPDYLGNVLDIAGLKKVCDRFGALLLVDDAHGAYLKFFGKHPMFLGADMCCDSAHKTLPCLTGGAYLHINNAVNGVIGGLIDNARAMFYSTSPSWLILQSLDKLNATLSEDYAKKQRSFATRLKIQKFALIFKGYKLIGDEPMKLTILTKPYGYYGYEIAAILRKNGIEAEFYDKDHIVFMFTAFLSVAAVERLCSVLKSIKKLPALAEPAPAFDLPKRLLHPREAALSLSEEIDVDRSIGRVFAGCQVSCPPAVPVIIKGEAIDESVIAALNYYGVKRVRVIKEA